VRDSLVNLCLLVCLYEPTTHDSQVPSATPLSEGTSCLPQSQVACLTESPNWCSPRVSLSAFLAVELSNETLVDHLWSATKHVIHVRSPVRVASAASPSEAMVSGGSQFKPMSTAIRTGETPMSMFSTGPLTSHQLTSMPKQRPTQIIFSRSRFR
jgi:hypothetical protein